METRTKIELIKEHRARHNSSLSDAKFAVEAGWTPEGDNRINELREENQRLNKFIGDLKESYDPRKTTGLTAVDAYITNLQKLNDLRSCENIDLLSKLSAEQDSRELWREDALSLRKRARINLEWPVFWFMVGSLLIVEALIKGGVLT